MKVGIGYDLHRLAEGRPLILGGVKINYHLGLLGHSDADVLTHAIIDALLGAAGLGDIGRHFPPGDPEYKDISSMILLEKTMEKIGKKGFKVVNVDSTIVCQAPHLSPYIEAMKEKISNVLRCPPDCLNVKATTEEGLGLTGSGKAISAYAAVLITGRGEL